MANWHIGQVSALGLEAILIGHIVDSVDLAVVSGKGVGATDSDRFVLTAGVVQSALLIVLLAIAGLPAFERAGYVFRESNNGWRL